MADREIDRQACFREVYDECFEKVADYARRRVAASEMADVVSDVFLVVWRRFDDLPPGSEALPWIYGVARRAVSERRRSLLRLERLRVRLGSLRPLIADDQRQLQILMYALLTWEGSSSRTQSMRPSVRRSHPTFRRERSWGRPDPSRSLVLCGKETGVA